MMWFRSVFASLNQWFYAWLKPPYQTLFVEEDLPARLERKTIYIVQEDGFLEQAAMLCPCGCRRVLNMNLIPDEHPCWQLTRHPDNTVTLYPSVWRKKNCRSHFWFRQGRIFWCTNSRRGGFQKLRLLFKH